MAYFPDTPYDFFLGYAQADDRAWVAVFEKSLREMMGREAGQAISTPGSLRNIARAAGRHIGNDPGDVVFANRRFGAIYAIDASRTRWMGTKSPYGASELPLHMEANSTVILRYE